MELMAEAKINCKIIGEVYLDADELSVLKLNPKFVVLTKLLDEDVEQDIELGITKLKYEIHHML